MNDENHSNGKQSWNGHANLRLEGSEPGGRITSFRPLTAAAAAPKTVHARAPHTLHVQQHAQFATFGTEVVCTMCVWHRHRCMWTSSTREGEPTCAERFVHTGLDGRGHRRLLAAGALPHPPDHQLCDFPPAVRLQATPSSAQDSLTRHLLHIQTLRGSQPHTRLCAP